MRDFSLLIDTMDVFLCMLQFVHFAFAFDVEWLHSASQTPTFSDILTTAHNALTSIIEELGCKSNYIIVILRTSMPNFLHPNFEMLCSIFLCSSTALKLAHHQFCGVKIIAVQEMSTIRNRKVIGKREIQQSTSAVCCVFGYHSILLSYSCLWATGTYNTYICCKRRRKTFQTDSIWVLSASQTKHNSAFRTSQIGQVNHVQVRYSKRRKRKRREFSIPKR